MDLETEALLFAKTLSRKRRNFKATLFSEISLKQHRDIQVYGLISHKVWLELESNREVVDYNELPKVIQIPCGATVIPHQFRFAVRKVNGNVEVIDIEQKSSEEDVLVANANKEDKRNAIRSWCLNQGIEYRLITSESYIGSEIRLSNLRLMLKFMESVHDVRDVVTEDRVNMAVASLGPLTIRQILAELPDSDQAIVIAQLARGILSERFRAPIDRRPFDGALVIDLVKP
jgi:hypothetical protein